MDELDFEMDDQVPRDEVIGFHLMFQDRGPSDEENDDDGNEELERLYAKSAITGDLEELDSYFSVFLDPLDIEYQEYRDHQMQVQLLFETDLEVGRGSYKMAKLFLKHGVDPSHVRGEMVPLQLAVKNPAVTVEVIKVLLEHGAKLFSEMDKRGSYLVLRLALENFNVEADILNLLLKQSSKVDNGEEWNQNFDDLFIFALEMHDFNLDIINLFIKYGANINARGTYKETPLHSALQQHPVCLDVVDTLLLHGADVNIADESGITPLRIALMDSAAIDRRFTESHIRGNEVSNLYYHRKDIRSNFKDSSKNQLIYIKYGMEMSTMSILKHMMSRMKDVDFDFLKGSISDVICKALLDDFCCTIMDKYFDVPLLRELLGFLILSVQEVAKMKDERLDCEFTLQEFLFYRDKLTLESVYKYIHKVLIIVNKKGYPIFKDVFKFVIKNVIVRATKQNLISSLVGVRVYPKDRSRPVSLNSNILCILYDYLSKKDVLNFMLASYCLNAKDLNLTIEKGLVV